MVNENPASMPNINDGQEELATQDDSNPSESCEAVESDDSVQKTEGPDETDATVLAARKEARESQLATLPAQAKHKKSKGVPTWVGVLIIGIAAVITAITFYARMDDIDAGKYGVGMTLYEYQQAIDTLTTEYGSIHEMLEQGHFPVGTDGARSLLGGMVNVETGTLVNFRDKPFEQICKDGDTFDFDADVRLFSTPECNEYDRYIMYYRRLEGGEITCFAAPGPNGLFDTVWDASTHEYRNQVNGDDLIVTYRGGDDDSVKTSWDIPESDNHTTIGVVEPIEGLSDTKKNILTLETKIALPWDNFADKAARKITRHNSNYCFATNADDEDININLLLQLDRYDVIIWIGHGLTDGPYGTCLQSGQPACVCMTEHTNGQLVDVGGLACISAKFIETNFEDGAFDGCIFFIGCCNPGVNYNIPNILLNKGAECVFVYTGTVNSAYDYKMCNAVFDGMAKGKTAGEALQTAYDKCGEVDPEHSGTKLVIKGNENTRLEEWAAHKGEP